MHTVMNHSFSRVPNAEIQRSSFDRSHGYKTTFNAGDLIPIFLDEALPGDTFNLHMNVFARLATPIKPIMDNMVLDSFFFAVPYRLVWTHWVNFMGEKTHPTDTTVYVVPQMQAPAYGAGGIAVGSLSDYFGLPTGPLHATNPGILFNSLFHRAYNLIWNEWFRDENLQDIVKVDTGDGPDTYTDYVLLKRGKRHDYFTSCLPWPQKGPDVLLPLGTSASVKRITNANAPLMYFEGTNTVVGGGASKAVGVNNANKLSVTDSPYQFSFDPNGSLYADLTTATAATINAIREAFQLQRLYERDARGGTRYIEMIKAHFGVTSPDYRLQRPEYLGGGTSPVNINPVAQTTPVISGSTPQGNMSGFGTLSAQGHGFTKSFTEHCLIIGLISVRADLNYQQGMNRMFSRRTRVDHYWPALSHLGEQAVLSKEIFCNGNTDLSDNFVFGYQERYAEYRYKPSVITGKFRSSYATSLDYWHLAQDFGTTRPTLGATFIAENPPLARCIAVNTEPHFLFDSYFNYICARPMPTYSVPGMVDHF